MRGRGSNAAHAEAVARRLQSLTDELESLRREAGGSEKESAQTPASSRLVSPAVNPVADLPEHTHIREFRQLPPCARPPSPPPVPSPPAVARMPIPGRHARRHRGGVSDESEVSAWSPMRLLAGRIDFGPAQLAVIAVVVAVGLGVTAWWVIRDDAGDPVPAAATGSPMETPAVPSAGATTNVSVTPTGPAGGSPPVSGATGEVVVDVAGKVRRPGIVVLPGGSRVADALKAAGGARKGVNLTGVNLARVLVDGEQILVGAPPVAGTAPSLAPAAPGTPGGVPGSGTTLVNINTATQEELETLPGVGPVTAQSIIDWRTSNGNFASVDQLLDVDGIGEKTLADLAPLVTV